MKSEWSLGYWLVEARVPLDSASGVQYRGIDRQPPIPGPDEDEGLLSQGRSRLLAIRNKYWDVDDSGELQTNARLAIELRNEFADEGIDLEVVLAEIVELPELERIPADLRAKFEQQLARWVTTPGISSGIEVAQLGIDVTYPFPNFHSAIRQPILRVHHPDLMRALNNAGLFPMGELMVAREAVKRSNERDTAWKPFCAVAISHVNGQKRS